jgi:hypothetical protein
MTCKEAEDGRPVATGIGHPDRSDGTKMPMDCLGPIPAKPISGQRHMPAASTGRTHDRKQCSRQKSPRHPLQTQGRPHMLHPAGAGFAMTAERFVFHSEGSAKAGAELAGGEVLKVPTGIPIRIARRKPCRTAEPQRRIKLFRRFLEKTERPAPKRSLVPR